MSNKLVYKNTLYLYVRMFVMMLISLYSSRIVLRVLGSSDYGLFNVVGGFTAFFFFISNSLSLATERYMAYAMGQNDTVMRKRVFSLSVWFFLMLSVLIFIVGLAVGIPFVKYQLNIPDGREEAAMYVYVLSMLSAIFSFIRIPFNASVIAHERMDFFAWISIVESVLKLLLLFFLYTLSFDKLIIYAFMLMVMSLAITLVYAAYCHRQFHDFMRVGAFDKELFKSMGTYTGWNLFGGIADMAILQGLSLVLNYFFGTIVNAAQAIADQIKAQVAGFVNNLNTASGPAITKHFAEGDLEGVKTLLYQISKLNYFLLLAVSAPIITVLPTILDIWLGHGIYPEKTVLLTRLVLINSLVDTIPGAVQNVVFASGRIKKYQLIISGMKFLSILSVSFMLFISAVPEYAYYVLILFAFPRVFLQIRLCCRLITLRQYCFYRNVVVYDLMTTAAVVALGFLTIRIIGADGLLSAILQGGLVGIETVAVLYLLGLNADEKLRLKSLVRERLLRH